MQELGGPSLMIEGDVPEEEGALGGDCGDLGLPLNDATNHV